MSENDLSTRNAILKATFELLSVDDVKDITIRRIANHADVAVSAINYHFQSKENLIDFSIKSGVGNIVKNAIQQYRSIDGEPFDKLNIVLNNVCNFISSLKRISQISMINDFMRSSGDDNITDSVYALNIMLKEVFDGNKFPKKSKNEILIIAYQITASIQFGFLRSDQLILEIGLDFFKATERKKYIDFILNNLIRN